MGTTPWSVITARFSSSLAMFAMAAHTLASTSESSDLSNDTISSRPPTNERTISPASLAFSMHGQMAHAALACTSGFGDLSSDHKRRTPSSLSMMTMLSLSSAHAPTAFVTFTRRARFVPVSRFTRCWMPPADRMALRFSAVCAHSPSAPTTLMRTSSGCPRSSDTSLSMARSSWKRATFSALAAHFHTAPVAAASSSLLSVTCSRRTSGSSPPNLRTRSRVSGSSAHLKMALAQCVWSSALLLLRFATRCRIIPDVRIMTRYCASEEHSCMIPTTGISSASFCDSSSLASSGTAPALRIASLFLRDLEHDHSARAPLRATLSFRGAPDLSPRSMRTSLRMPP
eukprot:Opistho-1_new@103887